jgi:methyl-accepting chemotaxis protein
VANEVKELAKETARATEDIAQRIDAIQADTRDAIAAIRQINNVVTQINDISSTIASAVEEQTATANEMRRNVTEASARTSEIAQNITSVASAAENTSHGASNTLKAAESMAELAVVLNELVSKFNYEEQGSVKRYDGMPVPTPLKNSPLLTISVSSAAMP